MLWRERERERERERDCFRFERRDFDFENAFKPKVVKPKTPTMTPKISSSIFVLRKEPKNEANLQ